MYLWTKRIRKEVKWFSINKIQNAGASLIKAYKRREKNMLPYPSSNLGSCIITVAITVDDTSQWKLLFELKKLRYQTFLKRLYSNSSVPGSW